jgi:hypothetical protein
VIEPSHDEDVWRPIDYDEAWAPFDARFEFKPDYYERNVPAIRMGASCLVVDLDPVFLHEGPRFAAGLRAINAAALRAFVWLAEEVELVALDWQHPSYRYSPAGLALGDGRWAVPVFPNGDYYAHMTSDLAWGTFGHPWQQTLTIWGDELIESLGAELLTWLPRHPDSP